MNPDLPGGPPPSPERLFETLNAYQRTAALAAAIELDVFTAIAEGACTAETLAVARDASARGMRILCDFLTICGLLTKDGERYGLAADAAAFLDRRSPMYVGGMASFLASPGVTDGFRDLAGAVRRGGSTLGDRATTAPDNPVWLDFARGMANLMTLPAQLLAGIERETRPDPERGPRVLDVAAGHGLFGITIARLDPYAEIVALDWPRVLEIARGNAQAAGVGERHRLLPGDAFEIDFDAGEGYDVVLLTNFLHHFDVPTCERLLRKVRAALRPDGRAIALEFVPNEDRVTPPGAAAFALIMLGTTPAGDAYTAAELEGMFTRSGFASAETRALPPTIQHVVIARA